MCSRRETAFSDKGRAAGAVDSAPSELASGGEAAAIPESFSGVAATDTGELGTGAGALVSATTFDSDRARVVAGARRDCWAQTVTPNATAASSDTAMIATRAR